MKVKLMLDRRQFRVKPEGFKIAEIQGYKERYTGIYHQPLIRQDEIDIEDLAFGMASGMTCKPALLGSSTSDTWLEQQLFMLDFDHETTIDEQLQLSKTLGIGPVFGYTSFSHCEEEHHFRLAFITDNVITDIEKRNKLQATLIGTFSKTDPVTYDPTRLFFGGCMGYPIYFDEDARINADDVIGRFFDDNCVEIFNKMKNKKRKNSEKYNNPKKVKEKKKKEKVLVNKNNLNDSYMENVKAIMNLDIKKLQELIGIKEETNVVCSEQDVYAFIDGIDLCEFLNLEEGGRIACILPDHPDKNPSAAIWTAPDGNQVYKCFRCDCCFKIIGLVEMLAQCKRSQAIEFIKSVYNIMQVKSEWVLEQQEILRQNALYLDTDDFKLQFPNIHKLIRNRKHHLQLIMLHFSTLINEEYQIDGKPVFFGSYKNLMQVCNYKDETKFSKSLTMFALLNMLTKLDTQNIPEKELNKAKSIAVKYNLAKLTGFYQFEEFGCMQLRGSEKEAKNLVANNITYTGLSREYVLRTFGTERANRIFPQYKFENDKGNSEKSDNRTLRIANKVLAKIEQQGYIKESTIKTSFKTEIQWKRSIQEILDTYGLVKVRASEYNKKKYGLPKNVAYQSFVIVKEQ